METARDFCEIKELGTNIPEIFFNNFTDAVVVKDKNLSYLYVNDSYCSQFCIENKDDLLGKPVNPYLDKKCCNLIYGADNEVKNKIYSLNYVVNTGNNKILNISTMPICSLDKFFGIISIVRDITQEEAIKEKFVNRHFEYINNEKHLQRQRETFVASVGHDLKNPTIAQIRSLELLLKGMFGELNSEQREIIEMVLDSCRYMNGMLSSLLATYRNYGGAVKLNFEEFNFMTLLSECVSEMLYVAKEKGVRIVTFSPAADVNICADRVQIKRVIMNLLSNGIKYAFNDTELKLTVLEDNGNLSFSFENKSPYLSESKQKSIFARYVSYSGVNNELGVGLGLYASKKIIESHVGNIFVKSYKDDRNIFGFTIPSAQDCKKEIKVIF